MNLRKLRYMTRDDYLLKHFGVSRFSSNREIKHVECLVSFTASIATRNYNR